MAEEGKTKEEQKVALSDLSTKGEMNTSTSTLTHSANQAALDAAISNLALQEKLKGAKPEGSGKPALVVPSIAAATKDEPTPMKLSGESIKNLMQLLEISYRRAEDLLRQGQGDRQTAIKLYVLPQELTLT